MSCKCEMWAPRVWLQLRHGSVKLARGWERSTLLGVGGGLEFFHPLHLQDSSAWKKRKGLTCSIDCITVNLFLKLIFFLKMWSTGIASESHTHKSCKHHIHTGYVSERKKTASLQTFCLTVRMDLTTQKYRLFCSPWPTVNEMGLDCNVKTCNVNLKNDSATIMYYLPAVSSFMMKAKTSKRYYYFFYSSHTKLLLFFNFQHRPFKS